MQKMLERQNLTAMTKVYYVNVRETKSHSYDESLLYNELWYKFVWFLCVHFVLIMHIQTPIDCW